MPLPTTATYSRKALLLMVLVLALASPLTCLLQCQLHDALVRALSNNAQFICPLGDSGHSMPAPEPKPTAQTLNELLPVAATVLPALLLATLLLAASSELLSQVASAPLTPPPRPI